MIIIARSSYDKNAINFMVDIDGAKSLILSFQKLLTDCNQQTLAVINRGKKADHNDSIPLGLSNDDDDKIEIKKKLQALWLTKDSCEYGIHLLKQYLKDGDFYPAEFCEFTDLSTNQYKMVYFKAINL